MSPPERLVQDSIDYVASDSIGREWSLRHWTILPVWELGHDPAGGCLFDQEPAIYFGEVLAHFIYSTRVKLQIKKSPRGPRR